MHKTAEDLFIAAFPRTRSASTATRTVWKRSALRTCLLWLTDRARRCETWFPSSSLDFQEVQESNFTANKSTVFTLPSISIGLFSPFCSYFINVIVYTFSSYAASNSFVKEARYKYISNTDQKSKQIWQLLLGYKREYLCSHSTPYKNQYFKITLRQYTPKFDNSRPELIILRSPQFLDLTKGRQTPWI